MQIYSLTSDDVHQKIQSCGSYFKNKIFDKLPENLNCFVAGGCDMVSSSL